MSWHKISPAIFTLVVFLLVQGFGTVLLFVVLMLNSPDSYTAILDYRSGAAQGMPSLELVSASQLSLIMMVVNILVVLCCYFLLHNIRFNSISNFASIRWTPGMLAVGGGLLGAMSISILTEKVEIPDELLRMSLAMSRDDLGILTLVIIGPIAEEFVFREAIEGEMLRRGANPWAAIIVSAVAFGAVHLNLAQGLYALPLGLIFGIIYYKTGNIILTSLLHILNNGFVVLMLRAEGEGIADVSCAEWFGSSLRAYIFMAFSAVFCFVLMRQFWNIYQPRDETMKSGLY